MQKTQLTARFSVIVAWVFLVVWPASLCGQTQLLNGGMEELDDFRLPDDWLLFGRTKEDRAKIGVHYSAESKNTYAGKHCLMIDAMDLKFKAVSAVQTLSAEEFAGKRVRLTSAIRGVPVPSDLEEEELKNYGQAYISIEVFRTDKSNFWRTIAAESAVKGFARESSWRNHEIVIDIPKNAENIQISLVCQAKNKAWFDGVTLDVLPNKKKITTPSLFDEPQPFFNWWLVLPALIIPIFCLSLMGESMVHRLALRFSIAYWGLYFLTWWFFLLSITEIDYSEYFKIRHGVVNWLTWNIFETDVFGFGSGSGDSLFNYAELFSILLLSIAIAIIWSCIDWRKTKHEWLRDGFRSFLRYSLAFVLLGYGLAKLNPETSQFQAPSFDRLAISYGESSPMGLLWTFMGASQPYSIFAGAGEVLAAILLIWRRTAILGACVAVGVMTNVVMLNFCYDVPVKLFSSHLLLAGILVLLPDVRLLINAFILHRSTEKNELIPPYANTKSIWAFRGLKALVIFLGIIYPVWETVDNWADARHPDCFGEYIVEEFESPHFDGAKNKEADQPASSTNESALKRIALRRLPFPLDPEQEQSFTDIVDVKSETGGESFQATVSFDDDHLTLEIIEFQAQKQLLPDKMQVRVIDEDRLELSGEMNGGAWRVTLRRRHEEHLLTSRGFHWVSQRPFNR